MLKNVTYIGKVSYGGKIYPGDHAAIINEDMFHKAQEIMKQNTHERGVSKNRKFPGLLSGIFRCSSCNASMTHGYTQKKNSRYRYYICLNSIKRGRKNCPTKSLNAILIEGRVIELLRDTTTEETEWQNLALEQQIEKIRSLVKLAEYDGRNGKLRITFQKNSRKQEFDLPLDQLKRTPGTSDKFFMEPPIRRQLLLAHQIQEMLDQGRIKDLQQLASWLGISKTRLEQILNLLFLAPTIQEEIICGDSQRLTKISERSLRPISIEADWDKQKTSWRALFTV